MKVPKQTNRIVGETRSTRPRRVGGTGGVKQSPPLPTEGNDGDDMFVEDDGIMYHYRKLAGEWRRTQYE